VLNSPSNPTGRIYTRAEIEAIAEVVVRHKIWLMSDEIYEYLLYDGAEHVSPASLSPEIAALTITTGGFSKTYSMTGWRLGMLAAPSKVAKAIGDIQSQTTSNATSFAQYGALAALQNKEKSKAALAEMLKVFDRRRLKMWEKLNSIRGIQCVRSEGAFYLFPDISGTGLNSADFASKLLESEQVAVVPGHAFGEDKCMRLSYATSDAIIDKGLERIERFCNSL
jgi:aspartate aminotransferase